MQGGGGKKKETVGGAVVEAPRENESGKTRTSFATKPENTSREEGEMRDQKEKLTPHYILLQ